MSIECITLLKEEKKNDEKRKEKLSYSYRGRTKEQLRERKKEKDLNPFTGNRRKRVCIEHLTSKW
jgi:hypothetical protein